MASITTTLSVKDNASKAIKNLQNQMQQYQNGHAEAVKALDQQNKEIASSEAKLNAQIKNLQTEKKKTLLDITMTQASMTKKQLASNKQEIESIKESGKQKEQLLGKDTKYTRSYYDTQIALAKENLDKQKKINNIKRAEAKRNADIQKEQILDIENQTKHQEQVAVASEDYRRTYENTRAVNAYEDALKKLNYQKKIGAITSKQYQAGLKKEKKSLKEAELASKKMAKAQGSMTNNLIRHLRQIETAVIAYYALSRAFKATIGTGLEVNKMIESNTYGIAALTSANTRMTDSLGNSLTAFDKFVIGQKMAKETMAQLRVESLKTPATFAQLTEIYQQATGQTLAMGDAFGTTVDDINKNTVVLAQRFSNIAGAIGQPMDRVKEEIRSALTGNVSTDSIISTMIFGSPTEANKAIKEARQKTNGLKELFDLKFEPFDILGTTKSYQKGFLQMQNAWEMTMADMVKKSDMFQEITDAFYNMANALVENQDDIIEGFDTAYKTAKKLVGALDDIAVVAATYYAAKGIIAAHKALNEITLSNIKSVKTLATEMKLLALTNPFTAWTVGIAAAIAGIYELQKIAKEISAKNYTKSISASVATTSGKIDTSSSKDDIQKAIQGYSKQIGARSSVYGVKGVTEDTEAYRRTTEAIKAMTAEVVRLSELEAKASTERKIASAEEEAKLLTKISLNKKVHEDVAKFLKKEDTEKEKLYKQEKTWREELSVIDKKLRLDKNQDIASQKILTDEQKNIESGLAETRKKIVKIELDEYVEKLESENDLWIAKQKVLGVEVKKSDIIMDTISARAIELSYIEDGIELNDRQAEIYKLILEYNKSINKEEEDRLKKQKEYWDSILDAKMESYDSDLKRLDIQIALTNSTLEWQNNLEGAAGAIAGISTALVKAQTTDLDYKKAQIELDKQRIKDLSDHKKGTIGYYDVETKYEKDSAKLKEQNKRNEINAYGQLAGAASQMFEKGSKEAAAMQAISSALALTNAVAAVMAAGKTATAYEVIPSMLAVAATATAFLSQIGVALGGGGGSSIPSAAETSADYQEQVDLTNKPILDRLDRQIELLEALGGYSGTVVGAELSLASSTFEKDKQTLDADILAVMRDTAASGWSYAMENSDIESLYGFLTSDEYTEIIAKWGDSLESYLEGIGVTTDEWAAIESDMQQITHDYTMSLLEQVEALSSTADSFEEAYDALTGTDFYKDSNLEKAQEEVDALLAGTDLSLADYLQEQISLIDDLESSLSSDDIALLLSDDIDNLAAQQELLQTLSDDTQEALDAGALSALNSKDSILLVADAMSELETASTDAYRSVYDAVNNIFSSLDDALTPTSLEGFNSVMDDLRNFQGTESELEDVLNELTRQSDALFDTSNYQTKAEMEYQQTLTKNQLDDIAEPLKEEIDFLEDISDTLVDIKSILGDSSAEQGTNIIVVNDDGTTEWTGTTAPALPDWLNTTFPTTAEWFGYASGGYTGSGGVNDIAGVVHGQEYVVNAKTTKDLGLNNSAGVFNELASEMKKLRQENSDMKKLLIKMTANSTKQLNTQRAIESNTFAQAS